LPSKHNINDAVMITKTLQRTATRYNTFYSTLCNTHYQQNTSLMM